MAARLQKVFHVRLNLQDGAVNGPHPLAALNKDPGAARVVRDHGPAVEAQGDLPLPPPAAKSDDSSVAVVREDKARAEKQSAAPLPPRAAKSDDGSVAVLRDEKMAVEDRKREEQVQPILLDDPVANSHDREPDDGPLSIRAIAITMAAVIVVSFAFTLSLPSILTRDGVESTATITPPPPVQPPPVQPTQSEQFGAIPPRDPGLAQLPAPVPSAPDLHPESYEAWTLRNPAPAPAPAAVPAPRPTQLAAPPPSAPASPAPAPSAPASKAPTSVANTTPTPALRAAVPTGKQAGGRAAGAEAPVPSAGKAATINLTAAEKAAVTRGINALKTTEAVAAPPRPAAARRPALTAEEQAAVERGLRELEKTAGQGNP